MHEGRRRIAIASVTIVGAPARRRSPISTRSVDPFAAGDSSSISRCIAGCARAARRWSTCKRRGWGHARAYSRAFVDRAHHAVAWVYYVDAGPRTHIGALTVEGNAHVPAAAILARAGLAVGDAYSTEVAHRAELALLDTGAFASVSVVTDADIQRVPEFPDSGGVLAPEQIAADGTLVPRALPDALALRIVVVEAPARQLRAELGIEGRSDARRRVHRRARHVSQSVRRATPPRARGQRRLRLAGVDRIRRRALPGGMYGGALARTQLPGLAACAFCSTCA